MADEEIEQADAGTATTYPIRAGEVKKGMIVCLKGKPCKVNEVTTSKTGKHGHAKAKMTGLDIFTGKKYQDISPTSHNMVAPFVKLNKFQIIDVSDDGYAVLMDDNGEMKEDLKFPDASHPDPELGEKIQASMDEGMDVFVVVTSAMEKEEITNFSTGLAE